MALPGISITYRSSSKMVAIDQFLEELCPLNLTILMDFIVFLTFFPNVCSYCIEILYMALPGISITFRSSLEMAAIDQTLNMALYEGLTFKFKDGCYRPILEELCPLNLTILRDFAVYILLDFSVFGTFLHDVYSYFIIVHLNFVHVFISIRFKINLEDDQIKSREIVS
jgi:hypothetical protein